MIDDALQSAIKSFVELRNQRRELENVVKKLKEKEDLLEQELWLRMEANGFGSIKTESYGNIIRTHRADPYIVDFLKFKHWCEDSGNLDLIREEAKRQELRNFISRELKAGNIEAIPPGVEYVTKNTIQVKGRHDTDEL